MDLCKKIDFSQLVCKLFIDFMDYNADFVYTLPAVFPRIRSLNLRTFGPTTQRDIEAININTSLFKMMAKYWKNVEAISDFPSLLNLSSQFLEAANGDHLTSILVNFYSYTGTYVHNKVKALIAAIHNAPSLKEISILQGPITTADMEDLHRGAPTLQTVKLFMFLLETK